MTGAAFLALIGGVRAAVFAGLLVLALVLLGWQHHKTTAAVEGWEKDKAAWALQTQAQADAYMAEVQKARQAEQDYNTASQKAADAYNQGVEDAKSKVAAVTDGLRDGTIQLRKQWASCETSRLSSGVTASAAGGTDEDADLRDADIGRLYGIGTYADNQVTWLQSQLVATRKACGITP